MPWRCGGPGLIAVDWKPGPKLADAVTAAVVDPTSCMLCQAVCEGIPLRGMCGRCRENSGGYVILNLVREISVWVLWHSRASAILGETNLPHWLEEESSQFFVAYINSSSCGTCCQWCLEDLEQGRLQIDVWIVSVSLRFSPLEDELCA